jgi:signal transduction histidine kinase
MYGEKVFCLRVCDDGTGIPSDILEGGRKDHFGLGGMRERARQIRGKLEIQSKVGKGTEIELTIASPIAYSASKGSATFPLFRKKVDL